MTVFCDSDRPSAIRPTAVVILGMHRSGISAITRVCSLLGAALPHDLLPPSSDNETGYWEYREAFELNKALLAAAGSIWFDDLPIPDAWFASDAARALRPRALAFLRDIFRAHSLVVLKDPRMCRLMPFWKSLFDDLDITPRIILGLRRPHEVFGSLRARLLVPGMEGASITCPEKAHLLWLRHVLEAEYHTRGLNRAVVSYDGLLANWRTTCERIMLETQFVFPVSLDEAAPSIEAFLSRRHNHHGSNDASPRVAVADEVYDLLAGLVQDGREVDLGRLDEVRSGLNAVEAAYAPLRAGSRRSNPNASLWENEMLERLSDRVVLGAGRDVRVLFVSGNPDACGHVYRVSHHAAALNAAGISAAWVPVTQTDNSALEADVVVIWRVPWNERLERLYRLCRAHHVPVGFDVDDLIFDPSVMNVETSDYLRSADAQTRRNWLEHLVPGYARTLAESDFAVVSTEPLARAARAVGKVAYVLPNGLDRTMIAAAQAAYEHPERPSDGYVRVGYASGTPTHQRDFAEIAPVLASLLKGSPGLMLTVVGCLEIAEFPDLAPYRDRIEIRPLVPFDERFKEYARFDINLAPLQNGNPFCEGKSELKYYEPALVAVPTVASATTPFRRAIRNGETGFCARTQEEWRTCLRLLIQDPAARRRLGLLAQVHAMAAFGPDAQSASARRVFLSVLGRTGDDKPDRHSGLAG